MTQPSNISNCSAAALDSCAARATRISKTSIIALSNPSALSIKPECLAGLRDEGVSLLISAALSKSTAQHQTQHEPNSERREYCFCWIFSDVLLGVLLERSSAAF